MQTIYEASILLVDDNPDLLVLVGDSLRTAGYTDKRKSYFTPEGGKPCWFLTLIIITWKNSTH